MDILLVTNNEKSASLLSDFLVESSDEKIFIRHCLLADEVPKLADISKYNAVLYDQTFTAVAKTERLSQLIDNAGHVPVVVLQNSETESTRDDIINAGASDCLVLGRDSGQTIIRSLAHTIENNVMSSSYEKSKKFLEKIMDSAFDAIVVCDEKGVIQDWNKGASDLFGYTKEHVSGRPIWTLMPECYHFDIQALLAKSISFKAHHIQKDLSTSVGVKQNGRVFPIELGFSRVDHLDGKLVGYISDITDKKTAQDIRRASSSIFDAISEGVMITDTQNIITAVNQGFTDITGYSEEEVLGQTPQILNSGRHGHDFYSEMWNCISTSGNWQGEIWNRRKNGSVFPEWLTITEINDENDEPIQYVAVFSDISKRAKGDDVKDFNNYDALTGLPNRNLLMDRIQQGMRHARRNDSKIALCSIDLDWFSRINGSLGSLVGDKIIEQVGARLATCVRSEDTVARVSGDEFIILLNAVNDEYELINLSKKFLSLISEPFLIEENEIYVTASIGVGIYPDGENGINEIIHNARIALERAKESGRNTFRFFQQEMSEHTRQTLRLERALRKALKNDELSLHYQPQVSMKDNKIVGAEALIRWKSKEFGNVSPAVFIPLAEKFGLINDIGAWVIQEACKTSREISDKNLKKVHLSINVSSIQFQKYDFIDVLERTLNDSKIDPKDITLELTESILMNDTEQFSELLNELSRLGFSLALDDFGTGYSSLSYIKKFPFDTLKIDKTFVDTIVSSTDDRAILKAIIEMGSTIGQTIVCEGVEHEDQISIIKTMNCDIIQGYFYHRPLPKDTFLSLLDKED